MSGRSSGGAFGARVFVFGAGKVGSGLARALRAAGVEVALRGARRGLPKRRIDAGFVILAIRDRDVASTAAELIAKKLVGHESVTVVHCAGALGPEALAAARGPNVSVAQMHPMISFASVGFTPSLERGQLHVDGDARAVKDARRLGKLLGMTPRTIPGLDKIGYHAGAGLVANGAAALAAGGVEILRAAGVAPDVAVAMLGPLLRSVAENVERLGMPDALTGPVRRGDAAGVAKHLATVRRFAPSLAEIYIAAARLQVPLARALGDAPGASFDAIETALDGGSKTNGPE